MKIYRPVLWIVTIFLLSLLTACNLPADTPTSAPQPKNPTLAAPALTIIPIQPDATQLPTPSAALPTATAAPSAVPPTATVAPSPTPTVKPLDRKDPKAVIEWVRSALEKKDPALLAQLASEKLNYTNYIEGAQPVERAGFTDDLKTRLTGGGSAPLCDAYGTYEKTLQVWTSGWTPDWEINNLCYANCAPLSPAFKSRKAAFFLTPNPQTGEYELSNVWLAEDKLWREVYQVQMHSCSDAYIPPPAVIVCPGAPKTRLQKNGYLFGSTTSSTSNNVRSSPGTGANVLGLLQPGKAAQVVDGPLCVEGYVWWKIRLLTGTLTGWTAEGKGSEYWLVPCGDPEKCGKP